MSDAKKRQAVVFPKEMKILWQLGENIRLAMKRRKITQTMVAERTGLSKPTLRNIERGEPPLWQDSWHYLIFNQLGGSGVDSASLFRRT